MYPRQPSVHFTAELEAFRRSVAAFVEREIRPHATKWEAAGEFPRELYRTAGRAGLLGLRYAPEYGGGGQDFLATCVRCEELAKSDTIGTAVGLMAQSEFALAILADEASDELTSRSASRSGTPGRSFPRSAAGRSTSTRSRSPSPSCASSAPTSAIRGRRR